jgi:3-oxoacyl-[acyl-carrier-protein] synthase-3
VNNVKIVATGSYAPERSVKNSELSLIVDTSDEWISSRSGIKERRISTGENTSELATKAALKALKNGNIDPLDIDLIILATTSPDTFTPSTACLVQAAIGAENATCFDVSAACSGFIFALNTASKFVMTGSSKTALVIGAEVLSKILNWEDRSTCVLFGDGAGAAIIQKSEENGIISCYTGSDGTKAKAIYCPATGVVNPYVEGKKERVNSFVSMQGKEVFKFAAKIIPKSVEEVLKDTKYTIEDIKYIVPHQANIRIIEAAAKRLEIGMDKFFINLDKYGNTSAATIPLALDEMVKDGLLEKGDKIIIVGFGGGLTYGAILIEWLI